MAMVETPDRIMTTGGWDNGGSGMWILLLAFLFMFRGGGFGGCGDGGYGGGYDAYKRSDAEYAALNRNDFDMQKEYLNQSWASRLQAEKCCCDQLQATAAVKCAVETEAEKTRALMVTLQKDATITAQANEICGLKAKISEDRIVERLAGLGFRRERERFCDAA